MRNKFLIFTFVIIIFGFFFSFKNENPKKTKTVKGRWYFIQDKSYKEIHANDTVFYLFDWDNDANRTLFLHYYINNDSLWSFFRTSNPEEQLYLYCWGKVQKFSDINFNLKKESSEIVFYKIDDEDSLFTNKISQNLYINHRLDSVQFNRWLNYQNDYYNRLIELYKKHPELLRK